jgi:anti-sigma-K factor RskA
MTLENDLKRTMRRQQPDAGFAARVLERVNAGEPPAAASSPRRQWWRAAAASVALAAVLGGYATHRVQEQRRGEEAREQVMAAMRIAGEKAHYARQEVREIGSRNSKER